MIPRGLLLLRRTTVGVAVGVIAVVLVAVACRISFPLELEWMEGGLLHQALRLQEGEPIYPPPGPDFVPFLYTPLYAAVLAGLGFVFGLDYALGRVVSILACGAIAAAMARAIRSEGKPREHMWISIGLFAAGYVFTFRWYDVGRPDTLYLAFVLWGLVVLRDAARDDEGRHRRALVAGALLGLGFWTKQTAAPFAVAGGIGAIVFAPRLIPTYAVGFGTIVGAGVLVGNALTDGWLWTYIYELHQSHAFNRERFTTKTWGMFAHAAPFVVIFVALTLVWMLRRPSPSGASASWRTRVLEARETIYWGVLMACGLLVSALGYATQWAEPNAFIPGVVMGAVFVGVSLPVGGRREAVALALLTLQLGFSLLVEPFYQPIQDRGLAGSAQSYRWQDLQRTIPTAAQRENAAALRRELENGEGEVLALHRPWWSVLAGGPGHVGTMGINDVADPDRKAIETALRDRVEAGHYTRIWTEGDPPAWLRSSLSGYRVQQRLQGNGRVRPLSGYMSEAGMVTPYRHDQVLMVPLGERELPPGARVIADFEDGSTRAFELEGAAFRRAVRGWQGRLPPVGPYGGQLLLSSAGVQGSLALEGEARSPVFTLGDGECFELLVGTSGRTQGLAAELLPGRADGKNVVIDLPGDAFVLHPVIVQAPPGGYRLRLEDAAARAALFVDDLRVVPCVPD